MKKVILFLGLFLMMAATLNAQADFSFGPKLGYKANSLSINRGDLMLYPKGYVTLGVFGRIMIKDFIIQPELMYNYSELYEGSVMFDPVNIINLNGVVSINHSIALPIYLGYQFVGRNNFNMRANVGPIVHFNIDDFIESMYQEWNYRFMNLGAALNIGVDIYRFTFDICYSMGLTNAIKGGVVLNSNIHPGERHNADTDRLNTFSITLGYRFGK